MFKINYKCAEHSYVIYSKITETRWVIFPILDKSEFSQEIFNENPEYEILRKSVQ
jgi:hypothetical protein